MGKLVLKDGTEIDGGLASLSSDNRLMIHVPGNNIALAAIDFSNSEKTQKIVCYSSIYKYTYTGYTNLYAVQYVSSLDCVELWLKAVEGAPQSKDKEIIVPPEYVPAEVQNNGN